jgi:N-acetylglucosaminyldiphosphoundecaprenol N-acetyl-beta-D-mannosaminyltransferase
MVKWYDNERPAKSPESIDTRQKEARRGHERTSESKHFRFGLSIGSFQDHVSAIAAMGKEHRSAYVCCVNVHMCMEAQGDPSFAAVVNGADLATVDGMPIVNSLNKFTGAVQVRVAGNDLMPALMAEAESQGLIIFLHGGDQQLDTIVIVLRKSFPLAT